MLFLGSLMTCMTFLFYFVMATQPLLTNSIYSSEILNFFKEKSQIKSIQWFNFRYMAKTNRKSETNIIPNFWKLWCHSFLYDVTKSLIFNLNSCFCNFSWKNYCFNTFSSPGLGLKLQKCFFKNSWRHKL